MPQLNALLDKDSKVLPFLKWAGGKRWMTDGHAHLLDTSFERYVEPFLGSGAVFFKLKPTSSILADTNSDLIETYRMIRDDWEGVERLLKKHHKKHSKEYYYEIRSTAFKTPKSRAAKFIYLNRTCWNGLYRVNLKGQFNVPIGTKTNVLLNSDDFEKISKMLSNTQLLPSDFERVIDKTGNGDLVFVDPPYTVKHNLNGFIKYNEALFSWDDQVRLKKCVVRAVARGAKVLVTNASHESIKDLYDGIGEHIKLSRASVISGKPSARGNYEEMIIKCY